MEAEISDKPSFAHLRVSLDTGESIIAEADAMASMSSDIEMTTRWNGGFFGAIMRRIFGGESLFVNEFTTKSGGSIVITQALPGDMECLELDGNTIYLQPGAFIACENTVNMGLGWAGFASFIGGEGLFRLKMSGRGKVWFGAYGGIYERDIDDEYIIDTGHLVGYDPSVSIKVGMSGGIFSSFFSGEGLITRAKGPGKVYLQSRSMGGLAAWTNARIY